MSSLGFTFAKVGKKLASTVETTATRCFTFQVPTSRFPLLSVSYLDQLEKTYLNKNAQNIILNTVFFFQQAHFKITLV